MTGILGLESCPQPRKYSCFMNPYNQTRVRLTGEQHDLLT